MRSSDGSRLRRSVTSHPSGSTKSTTSGPIPRRSRLAGARPCDRFRAGSCPFPPRAARCSPSTSTLTLWFVMPPPSTSNRALRPSQTRSTSAANVTRGSARRADRREASATMPGTHRRSRPSPRCRRRARPGGTRTRWSARRYTRTRRSSRDLRGHLDRTGSEPSAMARGSSSVRQRSMRSGSRTSRSASRPTKSPFSSFTAKPSPASNGVCPRA